MLAEVVLAPAIPIAGLLVVTFAFFAAAMLMWGTIVVFDYTLGLLMDAMAGLVKGVPFVGGIAKGAITGAKDNIRQRMVGAAVGLETTAGKLWHGIEAVARYSADSIVAHAHDTEVAIRNLVHSVIPDSVYTGTAPIAERVGKVAKAGQARDAAEAKARTRGIDATHRDLTGEKLAREQGIDNVGSKAHAHAESRVGLLERSIAAERHFAHDILTGRIGSWERITSYAAVGGVALATLTRVFPYWKCSNVRSFNRNLCRSPLGSLDWLFGLVALLFVTLNPEEVAGWADDTAEFLDEAWRTMAGIPTT